MENYEIVAVVNNNIIDEVISKDNIIIKDENECYEYFKKNYYNHSITLDKLINCEYFMFLVNKNPELNLIFNENYDFKFTEEIKFNNNDNFVNYIKLLLYIYSNVELSSHKYNNYKNKFTNNVIYFQIRIIFLIFNYCLLNWNFMIENHKFSSVCKNKLHEIIYFNKKDIHNIDVDKFIKKNKININKWIEIFNSIK
jgi:hypothetical protein